MEADAGFCGQCGQASQPNSEAPAAVPPTSIEPPGGSARPPIAPITEADLTGEDLELTADDIYTEPIITRPAAADETMALKTRLQTVAARLLHLQTDTIVELPAGLEVIRIGKPNGQIPPDIDVSGFPESEIVSRVHAHIRIEGDVYYIEDVGSSNGTYINNLPLAPGNRHRLRSGDRIALGKGDKVSLIFKAS